MSRDERDERAATTRGAEDDADGDEPEQSDEETEPEIQIDPGPDAASRRAHDERARDRGHAGRAGTTTTPEEQARRPRQRMRAARQLMDFLVGRDGRR